MDIKTSGQILAFSNTHRFDISDFILQQCKRDRPDAKGVHVGETKISLATLLFSMQRVIVAVQFR